VAARCPSRRRACAALRALCAALLLAASPVATVAAPLIEPSRGAAIGADPLRGADPSDVCLRTADRAADRHGVPRAVMRALTRTETGRNRGGALQP
jgi:hypothetical protein